MVIGDGDGGVLREVIKYRNVRSVTLCEIDESVPRVSCKYLPGMAVALDNEKFSGAKLMKSVEFSTGSMVQSTHWKQVVLYLVDDNTVCEGEAIPGTLSCAPNAKNPRDLDIGVTVKFAGKYGTSDETRKLRMC